jgi:hypothetical protein
MFNILMNIVLRTLKMILNMNNKAERIVVPEVSVTLLMSSLSISVN